MHKISEFFFEYIFFPTALAAYAVMIWGGIVWAIRSINRMRREDKKAEKGQGNETVAQNNGGSK